MRAEPSGSGRVVWAVVAACLKRGGSNPCSNRRRARSDMGRSAGRAGRTALTRAGVGSRALFLATRAARVRSRPCEPPHAGIEAPRRPARLRALSPSLSWSAPAPTRAAPRARPACPPIGAAPTARVSSACSTNTCRSARAPHSRPPNSRRSRAASRRSPRSRRAPRCGSRAHATPRRRRCCSRGSKNVTQPPIAPPTWVTRRRRQRWAASRSLETRSCACANSRSAPRRTPTSKCASSVRWPCSPPATAPSCRCSCACCASTRRAKRAKAR